MPTQGLRVVYWSGDFEVDLARRELRARGVAVSVGGRAFSIFEALLQSAGELVTKDDLMERVWPGAIVEEHTLQVHISAVRKALGPFRGMLKTESGRGYRLLGDWVARPEGRSPFPVEVLSAPAPIRHSLTNLPVATSQLIGRATATQQLKDLLSAFRAVTLTGPGGIGKTSLALDAARGIRSGFDGECQFVELASLSDPGLVPSAAARVLGLRLRDQETSADAVARALGDRKVLLILDNCEHVVDAVARLAETIVRMCPRCTVLATSREVLGIDGEHVFRVPPLDVPLADQGERDKILNHSAVELFIARTRALDSNFLPETDDIPAIAAICRHLDGIPLAIEFAAARSATLGVRQVASGLNDRFDTLTRSWRTALPRHQTLRATLDWSYNLLSETEAAMLRHLAVFVGDFSGDAAANVALDLPGPLAIDCISNLAAKSLIIVDLGDATASYRLLETTRLYAMEKLRACGEYPSAARRHAEYYRKLFVRAEADGETRTDTDWLTIYAPHLDNARAALDWALSPKGDHETGMALTVSVIPLWFKLSLMRECRERIEIAMARARADVEPRRIMQLGAAQAAAFLYSKGAGPEVAAAWTNVLAVADRLDDTEYRLWARWGLWNFQLNHGGFRECLSLAQQFEGFATNPADLAIGNRMVGVSLQILGELAPARQYLEDVLARPVDVTPRSMLRVQYDQRLAARAYLPRVLWLLGLPDQAMRGADGVVREATEAGQALVLCLALSRACSVALLVGNQVAAEAYVALLLDLSAAHGLDFWHAEARCHQGTLFVMRGDALTGTQMFRPAMQELLDYNIGINRTGFQTVMAGALVGSAEVEQGLAITDDALARAEREEELWCMPELVRVRGEFLLRMAVPDVMTTAETLFRRSFELAERQGALCWALRTATSLARVLLEDDRRVEARTVLAPVFGRFSEGFEMADLLAARRVLDVIG